MSPAEALVLDFAGTSLAGSSLLPMLPEFPEVPVTVAVPPWLGMADRHQLMTYLNPDHVRPLRLVSSTLCGACGRYPGRPGRRARPTIVCVDARQGWSAGLVRFDADGANEIGSWGIAPAEVPAELDDAEACLLFVDRLYVAVGEIVNVSSTRLLVIDDKGARAELIRETVRRRGLPWAQAGMLVGRGRQLVVPGGLQLGRADEVSRSIGALAHALTVRADSDEERSRMHVVVPAHTHYPSTVRHAFELGADDGAELHFDVFEQRQSAISASTVEHHLVARAHLVRERGFDQTMNVTFRLGRDGLLSLEPANAWRLGWQPGSLMLERRS